jgi:hypothetical protein
VTDGIIGRRKPIKKYRNDGAGGPYTICNSAAITPPSAIRIAFIISRMRLGETNVKLKKGETVVLRYALFIRNDRALRK